MSEMLDKIKRALCGNGCEHPGCEKINPNLHCSTLHKHRMEIQARAVLAAMRQPTPDMLMRGDLKVPDECTHGVEDIWQAMIDEVLK